MAEHVGALVVGERDQLRVGVTPAQILQEGQGEHHVADAAFQEDQNPSPRAIRDPARHGFRFSQAWALL